MASAANDGNIFGWNIRLRRWMIKHAEIELSALTKRGCVNVLKKEKRMISICNLPTQTNGNITAAVINYEIDEALLRFFKFIISGLHQIYSELPTALPVLRVLRSKIYARFCPNSCLFNYRRSIFSYRKNFRCKIKQEKGEREGRKGERERERERKRNREENTSDLARLGLWLDISSSYTHSVDLPGLMWFTGGTEVSSDGPYVSKAPGNYWIRDNSGYFGHVQKRNWHRRGRARIKS